MFLYLIIIAELILLYGVFWFFYLRQPRELTKREIDQNLWGNYNGGQANLDRSESRDPHLEGYMVPCRERLIFDSRTNRYVSLPESLVNEVDKSDKLVKIGKKITETLDKLNVRP